MPTPPPRHLARPRRPWRLLLFVFGLTTAVLAALVASATLLPQPEPLRRAPGVAGLGHRAGTVGHSELDQDGRDVDADRLLRQHRAGATDLA